MDALMKQGGGTMYFSAKTSQEIFRQDFTEDSALWYDFIRDDMQQKAKLADDILSGDGAGSATLTKEELLEILQE